MARSLGPKCKQCRREGMKLFLKGERCLTIAIRSATSASLMQVAVASRATYEGARNLTRHGLGPPSETR